MKIISGHQPVYLPWLGLFHKLHLCDTFVFMDTVQYLHQDWNNRNKIKTSHGPLMLSVPIDKKKSTGKMLNQINIKNDDPGDKNFWQKKHFQSIKFNYQKTPYFKDYIDELESMYMDNIWEKLIDICWTQFELFKKWLGLEDKEIIRMSEHKFYGTKDNLVLNHCEQLNGDHVVFGKHGKEYVDVKKFNNKGIKVYFQDYNYPEYQQRFSPFEPYLSVLDLIFNYGPKSMDIILKGNISYDQLRANNKLWI